MNGKVLLGFIVLIFGLVAGWYVLKGGSTLAPKFPLNQFMPEATATPEATGSLYTSITPAPSEALAQGGSAQKGGIPSGSTLTVAASVSYADAGFSPKTITVKVGTKVTFTNNGTGGMWVASAVHPTHQLLPGFDQLKSVAKGGTYEYAFTKVGTWKYHNHVKPADTGTVVVTQ